MKKINKLQGFSKCYSEKERKEKVYDK